MLFSLHLTDFSYFFVWFTSSFMPLCIEKMLEKISILLKFVEACFVSKYVGLSYRMLHEHLKRMYILDFLKNQNIKISIKFNCENTTIQNL